MEVQAGYPSQQNIVSTIILKILTYIFLTRLTFFCDVYYFLTGHEKVTKEEVNIP